MPVIAVVGNKGGAGKTTLAVNLAAALARRASTVVLDADPQGSALQWRAFADGRAAVDVLCATAGIESLVRNAASRHSHVVIDCPPSVHSPQMNAALRIADLALIPVLPSPVDLWATVHVEEAVARARASNPDLDALIVINQLEARTVLSRLMRDALSELTLPVADTAIRRRAVFRTSALEGKSVMDMGKRGEEALAELDQLINEVLKS